MSDHLKAEVVGRLQELPSGRHYGAAGACWVMVGRDLRDVDVWTIVPPAASLTYAWGVGGCSVQFDRGEISVGPGDCMWIDAGFAHRGENRPGSNFLTLFFPPDALVRNSLGAEPIGAAARPATPALALTAVQLAVILLDPAPEPPVVEPLMNALVQQAGTVFEGGVHDTAADDPVSIAADLLKSRRDLEIAAVAATIGLSGPEFSRRFRRRYRLTPKLFRKQVRLAEATRRLALGASVTDAAHQAGFADSAHLSRTFRTQYGIAPSRWADRFAASL